MSRDAPFKATNTPFDLTKYQKPYEAGRVALLSKLIPPGDGGNAIDIGCGPGFYSRELTNRGWVTTGVDTDPQNIESAKNYTHQTILGDGASALAALPDASYDLALMLEIIEHMPRTVGAELLGHIHRVLKPGARLLLSTPNRWSLEGLGGYYWGEKIKKWGKWQAWDSTHVHIYSSSEIIALLDTIGFAVDSATGYYYAGTLPLLGAVKLPLSHATSFPMNRLGFNLMLTCRKK